MAFWSYSQLALYLQCPFRYLKVRVEKIPRAEDDRRAYVGNVLALSLQRFYLDRWWADLQPVVRLQQGILALAQVIDASSTLPWDPGERNRALATCQELAPGIVQTIRDERLLGVMTYPECELQVHLDRETIVGRADLVIDRPGGQPGLVVVDGKAGGQIGKYVKMDQLRLYAAGVEQHPQFRQLPTRVGFWWFRHRRVVWRTPTPALQARFRKGVLQTISRLRSGDWTPKPSGYCRFCDVRPHCPEGQAHVLARGDRKTPLDLPDNLGDVSL